MADPGTDGVTEARRRWQAAADRLWPMALADGERYRQLTDAVGAVLTTLREQAHSLDELLAAERTGSAPPDVLAAACAVRADELVAERAGRDRREAIESARETGLEWAVLVREPTRVVEVHLASGRAVVATADPYLGDPPYRVAEATVDLRTGRFAGAADDGTPCHDVDRWLTEQERLRDLIGGHPGPVGSDGTDPMEGR
ncbi:MULTISPECIES: hypothetical protein [Pseudonocardia]|uniref:Uncharacterized protein n=2 Tax=Pseudonocardia TaxID=1847 RepID=A0A1Y2N8G6_PSEAH|nr:MULTISPECIES: hypothetical protein [Pseudonocardia]OSY43491.1 hypothetical protein BG845_00434 [Pseudonocardia autotrophica]TDN73515.1 hypothetical protein C8E95_2615 [Pseudonocardia autotrophica]BBG04259.1 hypothetical protein Pdca_54680 [Pseudonocardia autotrophica]GEC25598.1 hypothetical protein PSA01_26270 [Pseudonocardia saturnea]